jgi:uncharacterized membrane protein YfcA
MTLLEIAIFFGVSFVAAAINSVAGGGTFLTFPIFMLNGLTSLQANVMSTVALWPGVLASSYGYRGELDKDKKQLLPFLAIGLIGGASGALLLLYTPEVTFQKLVPWLLLLATLVFTFGRTVIAWIRLRTEPGKDYRAAALGMQIVIAIYGGYFGAGVGILTLAMLQVMGQTHMHRMNALKTVLTGAINATTILVFIFSGIIIWPLALVMMAGAACGGYCGTRLALKISPERIRMLVSVVGFSMTAYFFLRGAGA